eukprot:TRINITY_DN7684_c0_g1_i1.p1 TRINITY_DN7684_c0_g1~~TRINITY_DN7684_c0_g1_i1.p1  ORF type:complete len:142 (+),score=21.52 TRINITY_DN7684_c0_g1_i1:661-1086(+)
MLLAISTSGQIFSETYASQSNQEQVAMFIERFLVQLEAIEIERAVIILESWILAQVPEIFHAIIDRGHSVKKLSSTLHHLHPSSKVGKIWKEYLQSPAADSPATLRRRITTPLCHDMQQQISIIVSEMKLCLLFGNLDQAN